MPRLQILNPAQLKAEVDRCMSCAEKPCQKGCPCDCSPHDFLKAIAQGRPEDFRRAAAMIMYKNPMGGICGDVCPDNFCMASCARSEIDGPINIPAVQATVIHEARRLKVMPRPIAMELPADKTKKVAILGAGPAGVTAAAYLARNGHQVDIYEKYDKSGGALHTIPPFRLPRKMMEADIEECLSAGKINQHFEKEISNVEELGADFDAVVVGCGLHVPRAMRFKNADKAIDSLAFLRNPAAFKEAIGSKVVVMGGGAVAVDCAATAKHLGATEVIIMYRRSITEMPLSKFERQEILEEGVDICPRTLPQELLVNEEGKVVGLKTSRVGVTGGRREGAKIVDIEGSDAIWNDVTSLILAVGNSSSLKIEDNEKFFYAGEVGYGAGTVVESAASAKECAKDVLEYLTTGARADKRFSDIKASGWPAAVSRSDVGMPGYNLEPVGLETDFFGIKMDSPFLLSASPLTDGYRQVKSAYEKGWSGAIMKTAFDGVKIHVPNEYMEVFDESTFGNCDNVSGHPLSRVCKEIKQLREEFPNKLTMGSTGGPITGNDEADKQGWQSNTKMLEDAGAQGVEYSLSCPQGGDGSEGSIASQNAALSAKIVGWVLEKSDPNVPKLFKMSSAATSVEAIIKKVKEVFDQYPDKKAGITLANSFPSMMFQRDLPKGAKWEKGRVIGLHGNGVLPISYLALSSVSHLGVFVSGNGGPMDHVAAANFLALGCKNVQFCTLPTKEGLDIIDEIKCGLSHILEARGFKSVEELIGAALPDPIVPFDDLPGVKSVSAIRKAPQCVHCGNCTRCPYQAIQMFESTTSRGGVKKTVKMPKIDYTRCIGCSICVLKCPGFALAMKKRNKKQIEGMEEK